MRQLTPEDVKQIIADSEKMIPEQCENCEFWIARIGQGELTSQDDIVLGECRRNPPLVMRAQMLESYGVEPKVTEPHDALQGLWPLTEITDWCGEYKQVDCGEDDEEP